MFALKGHFWLKGSVDGKAGHKAMGKAYGLANFVFVIFAVSTTVIEPLQMQRVGFNRSE